MSENEPAEDDRPQWMQDYAEGKELIVELAYEPDDFDDAMAFLQHLTGRGAGLLSVESL